MTDYCEVQGKVFRKVTTNFSSEILNPVLDFPKIRDTPLGGPRKKDCNMCRFILGFPIVQDGGGPQRRLGFRRVCTKSHTPEPSKTIFIASCSHAWRCECLTYWFLVGNKGTYHIGIIYPHSLLKGSKFIAIISSIPTTVTAFWVPAFAQHAR